MKTEELNKLSLAQVRQLRDALILKISKWPTNDILDDDDSDWMDGNPEKFLNELCQCKEGWITVWLGYQEEIAYNSPAYSKEWSELRQLIERVNELEIAEMEKRRQTLPSLGSQF